MARIYTSLALICQGRHTLQTHCISVLCDMTVLLPFIISTNFSSSRRQKLTVTCRPSQDLHDGTHPPSFGSVRRPAWTSLIGQLPWFPQQTISVHLHLHSSRFSSAH